jgi:hypothetical protein
VAVVRLAQDDFCRSCSAAAMIAYSACDIGLNEYRLPVGSACAQ